MVIEIPGSCTNIEYPFVTEIYSASRFGKSLVKEVIKKRVIARVFPRIALGNPIEVPLDFGSCGFLLIYE